MAAARGGGVGGTVAAARDDSSREVAAEAAEAAEAAKAAFGGVLDGVAYPCSPDARSYCDGETEVEHEIEAEAKMGAVGGATSQACHGYLKPEPNSTRQIPPTPGSSSPYHITPRR